MLLPPLPMQHNPSVTTHVFYLTSEEASSRCLGFIGGKSKFCVATNCSISKHDSVKFRAESGIYIRVPKKLDQCLCSPFLPDDKFDLDVASDLLSSERILESWITLFSSISAEGLSLSREVWEKLEDRKS